MLLYLSFPICLKLIENHGVSGRAIDRGLAEIKYWNPREFAKDRHRTVDDRPFGGGPGMVMLIEPLKDAIISAKLWLGESAKVVYLSPQGSTLNQAKVNDFAVSDSLILIAGRYEGIDERLIEMMVDEELSIGDYVLSGGELPAMVLIDSLIRQLPGALGHDQSAAEDSFFEGLLDCPHYTRPEHFIDDVSGKTYSVPNVLMSGNHQAIERWRKQKAVERTRERRPDLLKLQQNEDHH